MHGCLEIPDLLLVLNIFLTRSRKFCLLYKLHVFHQYKCPEAMIDDCLKSDNFYLYNKHIKIYIEPISG